MGERGDAKDVVKTAQLFLSERRSLSEEAKT